MSMDISPCPLCGSNLNAWFDRRTFQFKGDLWLRKVGFSLKWPVCMQVIVSNISIYILLTAETIFKHCSAQVFRWKESSSPISPARGSFRYMSMFSPGRLDLEFDHFQSDLRKFSELKNTLVSIRGMV